MGDIELRERDSGLAVAVSPGFGGELASLRLRGEELLFRAPGEPFAGGAPWLFPAVGRSFAPDGSAHSWVFAGRRLGMPLHGFASARAWEGGRAGDAVVCRTTSDGETRRLYPFDFELEARYAFSRGELSIEATVAAAHRNDADMPFSIGNHLSLRASPAAVLRTPAEKVELLSERGLLTGESRQAGYAGGAPLAEAPELRNMVLGGYAEGRCWAELALPGRWTARVSHQAAAFPAEERRFVLWGDEESRFLCVEPWCGRPNSLNEGRGALRLAPGGRFSWRISVRASPEAS